MKKRPYRAVRVKQVNVDRLSEEVGDDHIVFGVDVGKEDCFGWLQNRGSDSHMVIRWKNPQESRQVVGLLKDLGSHRVEVAMEPSGSYGDPVRSLFWGAEIPVYRVSPKRSHDAVEVFDGVPSSHDAKSAGIVARLHMEGTSQLWEEHSEAGRDLRAGVDVMDMFEERLQRGWGRMEGAMARYWPEIGAYLDFDGATFLELLMRYGGPRQIGAEAEQARVKMRKTGGPLLSEEKIEQVLSSCRETIGVEMTAEEVVAVKHLAADMRKVVQELREAKRRVERLSRGNESIEAMAPAVGKMTAAVLVALGGDPAEYLSGTHWQKGLGLNLKERSSGKHIGRLKITKRGSGEARRYLYLATLRMINRDIVVRAWYQKKVIRDGGVKMKAIVAIMRKLAKALWYVAQGQEFDSSKLFDVKRLGLEFSAV